MAEVVMVDDDESEEESESDGAESNIDIVLSDDEDEDVDLQRVKEEDEEAVTVEDSEEEPIESISTEDDQTEEAEAAKPATGTSTEDCIMVGDESDENAAQGLPVEVAEGEGDLLKKRSPAWHVVEQIRREEFGVDVVLSEDGQRLMKKQQERLGRSLDRLSRDLYSKDTHFVLELIQNADDNTYPIAFYRASNSVRPAVKFVVNSNAIMVMNNECGFREKDIRALCDVGKSTKGKHKYGYIGQKGIGFKSVFRVTDRPEIHSNSYHMCFDVNSGPTGYILPHWIGKEEEEEEEDGDVKQDGWTTRIVLPLKSQVDMSSPQSLAARFHDVHPSLLLFLHRLKHMTVVNKVENYTLKVRRQDLGDNIIEIKHSKGTDRWFVVRKTLDASKISLQAKSGVDVLSTEIAMAFPLQSEDALKAQVLPEKQPVFAFLPLRSYGFRFVIQGDFDVPSSREDVDRDSLWNQWLCSEIHHLFVEALETFKAHEDFSPIEAVCRFLQFIPLEGEILDFFGPVATQILQLLRAQPCLPTAVDGTGIQWRLPSQLVTTSDPLVRQVIPSSVLRKHLSLDYLHPEVAATMNQGLRTSLGVQTMSLNHLLEIRRTQLTSRDARPAEESEILQTAKWLTCIYRAMDDLSQNDEVIATLRKLPTIPLVSGQMIALEDQSVFFPLEKEQRKKKGKDLLLALASDLNTLHPSLLHGNDAVADSQVCRLLEKLGVKRLNPHDITHHHIMGVLKSDAWKNKSRELLLSYVVYIKQQLEVDPSLLGLDELRQAVILLTNHGPVRPLETYVHFTPAYDNKLDLQKMLPGYSWVLLDGSYLSGVTQPIQVQQWRAFFSKLGVLDFLALKSDEVTLTKDQLLSSVWSGYADLLPPSDTYKLQDVSCPEFTALVKNNKVPQKLTEQCKLIFQVLDQAWDGMYSNGSTVTMICNSEGNPLKEVETSFALELKNLEWVPAVVSLDGEDEDTLYSIELRQMKPNELFIPFPEIEKLLAHHVPYLEPDVKERSTFAQFLGVNFKVTIEFVKSKLISWCSRQPDDAPRHFTTTLCHIKEVYRYLEQNLTPKDLQDLLHQHPVVLVFDKGLTDEEMPHDAKFLTRQEVRWSDPSELFQKYEQSLITLDQQGIVSKPVICQNYKDMEDFFLKSCRIQKFPNLEEHAQLLLHIVSTSPSSKNPTDVLQILTIIGREISATDSISSDRSLLDMQIRNVKLLLGGKSPCLPTKSGHGWVGVVDKPMIADDRALERLFQGNDGVVLLECGEKVGSLGDKKRKGQVQDMRVNAAAVQSVYEMLGLRHLSECVEVAHITEMYQPCPSLQLYVHHVIVNIQKILFHHYEEIFETLRQRNIQEKLATMTFGQVGKLELVYSLQDRPNLNVVQTEKCQIIDHTQFNVHHEHVRSYNDINNELARYFSNGNTNCQRHIKAMLMDAMEYPQRQDMHFIESHELYSLPPTEEEWVVPAPIFHPPPPQAPPRVPSPVADQQQGNQLVVADEPQTEGAKVADGSADGGDGIRAWPPKSRVGGPTELRPNAKPSGSTMWPPPKPPEHFDRTSLPGNIRPSRYAPVTGGEGGVGKPSDENKEGGEERGETRERHEGDRPVRSDAPRPVIGEGVSDGPRPPAGEGATVRTGGGGIHHHHGEGSSSNTGVVTQMTENSMVIDYDEGDSDGRGEGGRHSGAGVEGQQQGGKKRFRSESGTENDGTQQYQPRKKPVFYNGPSTWTEEPSDIIYEELHVEPVLSLPERMTLDDRADQPEIGRWGEQLVNDYLLGIAEDPESGIISVKWMNEEEESGEPYDFIIALQASDSDNPEQVYIEVKSTSTSTKGFFEISSHEFKFAHEMKEHFHLYRVFNAGREGSVRLTKLENLAAKMDKNQVRLCMVV